MREVEAALRRIAAKDLTKEPVRRYVAALWNNLGILQERHGGIDRSVAAFKQAVTLDPSNAVAHLNLTQAYWGLRDPALTPEFLQRVIRLAPNEPFPRLALADVLIERGDMKTAATQLAEAEPAASENRDLRAYAQRLARRVKLAAASAEVNRQAEQTGEEKAISVETADPPEAEPATPSIAVRVPADSQHFVARFEGQEDPETWTRLRAILEYAYRDICHKLGRKPAKPIMVVLHTSGRFEDSSGTPAWADSLFDGQSGTIHVPTRGALDDLGALSRVVRHQFVHALLQESLGPRIRAVPSWLAEGVALQLPDDPWPDLEETERKGFVAIPLAALRNSWRNWPGDQQAIAYVEAHMATQAFVDRQGIQGVRHLLSEIGAGKSLDSAMEHKLSLVRELQPPWRDKTPPGGP